MNGASGKTVVITLLLAVFALAFQLGRSTGFETGSEWALVQADIVAREAGLFMPVYMKDGHFRVVVKQPRGLYRRAWQHADKYEDSRSTVKTAKVVSENQTQSSRTKSVL